MPVQTRWPWMIAATLVAPLWFRAAALVHGGASLEAVDAQGVVSDVGVGLLVAALAALLGRAQRLLALVVVLGWVLAHYANYELVVALGSPLTLREAHFLLDPTFFAGSALAFSRPGMLAAALAFAALGAWLGSRARVAPGAAVALAGLLLCGAAAAWPDAPEQPVWRQVDFLQRDVSRWLARREAPTPVADAPPAEAMLERWPELAGDLSGEARMAPAPRARNVLLVVLESVSGLHVASVAAWQDREPDADMPALDAFARKSLRYPSFVAHQRKTNRGLYALLCGELPNLGEGTPKMSAAAERPWRVCLPQVLQQAGLRTLYLQAAPLSFMLKDRFMQGAGFERIDGFDGDEKTYTESAWGVDDRAFFERAAREVAALREDGRPWFLTLLNVGTHHPYTVPDDFEPGARSFRRAAAYLDAALGPFFEALESSGVLDDTLVLVTSDESAGVAGFDVEPVFKGLSQTWGLLLARGPGVAEGVVEAPFGLSDLALSVVDYLGLADRGAHFFGRSVFRDYATPRHLFFGNVNVGSLGAFEPQGTLLVCSGGVRCRRHPVPDARWFGALPGSEPAGDDDAGVRLLQDVARRSAPSGAHRPDAYALLLDPVVELEDSRAHMLHGGQYVHLAADEWIEVRYAVSVEGDPGASVEWVHRLAGFRNEKLFARRERLEAGQRLELVYRYVPEGEKGQIQCRTTARRVSGDRARLLHGEARMLIRRGERPPVGTQLLRFDVASD